ncbi:MAG: hypothetical protein AVDCRST_MAG93-3807, partial [uncultured Chloroflexia bacterium]
GCDAVGSASCCLLVPARAPEKGLPQAQAARHRLSAIDAVSAAWRPRRRHPRGSAITSDKPRVAQLSARLGSVAKFAADCNIRDRLRIRRRPGTARRQRCLGSACRVRQPSIPAP